MEIYNCKKTILTTPKNFIPYNSCEGFKEQVTVDACLAEEIKDLWNKGVVTCGCCCGHGRSLGWIGVDDSSIPIMESLGYEHYIYEEEFGGVERKDGFIPKSYKHFYNGYSDGYQG